MSHSASPSSMPRTAAFLRLSALALLAASLAAASLPAFASVTLFVEAASNNGGNGKTADNAGNEFPPGGAIHGVAAATRDDSSAFVADGGAGACDFFGGLGCAYELPQNRGMGEIRGDLGRLKAAVYASTDSTAGVGAGVAGVELGLVDVLETTALGDLRFDLHFDVDNVVDGIPSTLNENTFRLSLSLQPLVAGAATTTFDFTLPEFDSVRTTVDRSFVLAAMPAATRVLMTIDIFARNECGTDALDPAGVQCSIWTDAGHTAYIGVHGDYVSLSGYSYPGFAAAAPVPEPEIAALLAAGLIAIGAMRCRRSSNSRTSGRRSFRR